MKIELDIKLNSFCFNKQKPDDGHAHRYHGVAYCYISNVTRAICKQWYLNGRGHCVTGPAFIFYYTDGFTDRGYYLQGKKIK